MFILVGKDRLPKPEVVDVVETIVMPEQEKPLNFKYSQPAIRAVRYLPNGDIEIVWFAPDAKQQGAEKFTLDIWNATAPIFDLIDPVSIDSNSYVFSPAANESVEYVFFINAIFAGQQEAFSASENFTYELPAETPPPSPDSLTAEQMTIEGETVIKLSWQVNADEGSSIAGFMVLADDEVPGLLLELHDFGQPVTDSFFYLRPQNTVERNITFAVASVLSSMQRSELSSVIVPALGAVPQKPAGLIARQDTDRVGKIIINWEYPESSKLQGFRLFEHGLLIADEMQLDANTRFAEELMGIPEWEYRYQLQAVFEDGVLSPLAQAPALYVENSLVDFKPPPPGRFSSKWLLKADQLLVHLSWNYPEVDIPIKGYRLSMAESEDGPFSELSKQPVEALEFEFPLTETPRELVFKIQAVTAAGVPSEPTFAWVPSPGEAAIIPRLARYAVKHEAGATFLDWSWRYPDQPLLGGFRIYLNGQLVGDENKISKDARSWRVGPLVTGVVNDFELQAVMLGGKVSPRSPKRKYLLQSDALIGRE